MKRLFTKLLFVIIAIVLCLPFTAEARRRKTEKLPEKYKSKCVTLPKNAPLEIWANKIRSMRKRNYTVLNDKKQIAQIVEVPEKRYFSFNVQNKTDKTIKAFKFQFKIFDIFKEPEYTGYFVSTESPIKSNSFRQIEFCSECDKNDKEYDLHEGSLEIATSCEFKVMSVVYEDGTVENF